MDLVSAEIEALLKDPPPWLDTSVHHDASPLRLSTAQQIRLGASDKLIWRWECAVRGPNQSPYEGLSYRVLVRIPAGYPRLPPRLLMLSIVQHLEVELRDPYEGSLEDVFYESLAARVGASLLSVEGECVHSSGLRFIVGQRVICNVGEWLPGRIARLLYSEPHWKEDKVVPYQVVLDNGQRVYAPADDDRVIRAVGPVLLPATVEPSSASTSSLCTATAANVSHGDIVSESLSGKPASAAGEVVASIGSEKPTSNAPIRIVKNASTCDSATVADAAYKCAADSATTNAGATSVTTPTSISCTALPDSFSRQTNERAVFSIRSALELLQDFLAGPLENSEAEYARLWQARSAAFLPRGQ